MSGARRATCASASGAVPGMERLLPALEGLEPAYLVGGAVRDLLRGAVPNDIDIAVEGDARSAARAVAERLGSDAREYERFGTATVETPATPYNFATTRKETYDEPGALPRVAPASLADDLRRRDFSINAMAVGLTGDDLGHLYDPTGGLPTWRPASCACSTSAASSTIPRACCGRCATPCGSASRSTPRPSAWRARPWRPTPSRPSLALGSGTS